MARLLRFFFKWQILLKKPLVEGNLKNKFWMKRNKTVAAQINRRQLKGDF
jgi:hypothetical protein